MTPHRRLIAHELGHGIVGLIAGLRVKRVSAPPPKPDFFDSPPADPDLAAGFVEFHRGGDRRAYALALLAGPLAEGKTAPSWPLVPHTDDEHQLLKLLGETDEVCYLECVRDAAQIIGSDEFSRMNMLASELLATPPYQLDQRQLKDVMQLKSHEDEEQKRDPRELEAELVERGVLAERGLLADSANAGDYAEEVVNTLSTENGNHREKAHHSRISPIRTKARDDMLALFRGADHERKSMSHVTIATFDC